MKSQNPKPKPARGPKKPTTRKPKPAQGPKKNY